MDAAAETKSMLQVRLHPLVVLNITDHWTRNRVNAGYDGQNVVGVLLGTQAGRDIEIHTSFELVVEDGAAGGDAESVNVDIAYLEGKKSRYSAVFPKYEVVGWYTTGRSLADRESAIHRVLMRYNESPLVLQMDTTPPKGTSSLPLQIYETVVQVVNDVPTYSFSKLNHTIESEESERISVDNVAHGTGCTSIATPLRLFRDALIMLQDRVAIVKAYLIDARDRNVPLNHSILRDISALCHKLPSQTSPKFLSAYTEEYTDSMLIAYVGALTRTCSQMHELVEKHGELDQVLRQMSTR